MPDPGAARGQPSRRNPPETDEPAQAPAYDVARRCPGLPGFRTPQDHAAALAFFKGHDAAHRLFHQVLAEVAKTGPFELTASKSRVSVTVRTRVIWCHEANDDGSIWFGFLLPHRVESPRLRSGPAGGRWSHHTKVRGPQDLDADLVGWLREAYEWDRAGIKEKATTPARKAKP